MNHEHNAYCICQRCQERRRVANTPLVKDPCPPPKDPLPFPPLSELTMEHKYDEKCQCLNCLIIGQSIRREKKSTEPKINVPLDDPQVLRMMNIHAGGKTTEMIKQLKDAGISVVVVGQTYLAGKYKIEGVITNTETGKVVSNKIPIFVLLGTDAKAPYLLQKYTEMIEDIAGHQHNVEARIQEFQIWQRENFDRVHAPSSEQI
jgi:hypothetical protein